MEAFTLEEEEVRCEWCFETILKSKSIKAFDGRFLCGPKVGNVECWKKGVNYTRSIRHSPPNFT